jgi:hypothetical protein
VCNRILQDLGEFEKVHFVQSQRIARPPLLEGNMAIGFFDGASQIGGDKCGADVILKCQVLGVFNIKLNYGVGTNTRGNSWPCGVSCFFVCINMFLAYSWLETLK